jgi:hypothetical protein
MSEEPKIQKGPLSGVPFEFLASWSDKGIHFSDPIFLSWHRRPGMQCFWFSEGFAERLKHLLHPWNVPISCCFPPDKPRILVSP